MITSFVIEEWLRPGVGVGVRERSRETVGQRLQESDDLVFLLIAQPKLADGHVFCGWHLRHWPAIDFLGRSLRTVSRRDVERKHVAGIVKVDDLLEALEVTVVHVGLDEVRARPHVHVAARRHLKLAVELRHQGCPIRVGVVRAAEHGADLPRCEERRRVLDHHDVMRSGSVGFEEIADLRVEPGRRRLWVVSDLADPTLARADKNVDQSPR